jgi:hypothetical protein
MRLRRWTAGGPAATAVCAGVAIGVLTIAPAAAAPTTRTAACVAPGARHVDGKRATTTYWVDLFGGVTCDFAKPWVAKLTHARPRKYEAEGSLAGGPRGWKCYSGRPYPALAYRGGCNTKQDTVYFSWKPRYKDTNPAVRVYTYDYEVVVSATIAYSQGSGGGTLSSHWTMTARGLRIRTARRNNDLPTRYRKAGWEMSFISAAKTDGTATATVDYSNPPEGCPAHEAEQFKVSASSWSNFGVSGIVYSGQAPPCLLALDLTGGPPDSKGLCTGLAGACWEVTPDGGNLHFANTHKRPRPFMTPLAQILKGLSWAKTFQVHRTDAAGVTTASVRFSLTRRRG